MKDYFILQFKIIKRKLIDFGINPIIAVLLGLVGFLGASYYLFAKTEYAGYIYIALGLSLMSKLGNKRRNDFLKSIFKEKRHTQLRLIENGIIALPFVLFLLYKQLFLYSAIMFVLSSISILWSVSNIPSSRTFPTIFYKKPFEFAVGFRKSYLLFFATYVLTVIAINVDNFNLGLFALIFNLLVTLTFYTKPENEYYVWTFNRTPKSFLQEKIKTGIIYSTLLSCPILIALALFYMEDIIMILIFLLLGYIYLSAIILAKYSAFPHEISLPQGIIMAIAFSLPPVLIFVIPYFYFQALTSLKRILG